MAKPFIRAGGYRLDTISTLAGTYNLNTTGLLQLLFSDAISPRVPISHD